MRKINFWCHAPDVTPSLRLYSINEVAQLTGLSRASLDREIRDGHLMATKIRARVLVSSEQLEAWIYRSTKPPEEPSTICRVPRFAVVSKDERLTQAQAMRERAREKR